MANKTLMVNLDDVIKLLKAEADSQRSNASDQDYNWDDNSYANAQADKMYGAAEVLEDMINELRAHFEFIAAQSTQIITVEEIKINGASETTQNQANS